MPIETIVRPFQTGDDVPPSRVYLPAKQPPIVMIQPGRTSGNVKTANETFAQTVTFYLQKQPTEIINPSNN
jgi:hypothetical protein